MASILYVGTDEGVVTLKSEDGRTYKVEHHGLKDWAVPEVTVSPSAPNRIFAGTRGDGVWLSEDFGATWKKPCYGKRGPGKVRCLTIDPLDANTLYAGTEPIDVFVSRDGARSWEKLNGEIAKADKSFVEALAFDPADADRLYAARRNGDLFGSLDSASRWFKLDVSVPELSDMKAASA